MEKKLILYSKTNNVLEDIKKELDEHRESINENANEMQYWSFLIEEMQSKIEKFENLFKILFEKIGIKTEENFVLKEKLNAVEKKIAFVLYQLTENRPFTNYEQIAKIAKINEKIVQEIITNLIEKGVPIIKKYEGGKAWIAFKNWFRALQTKQNLLEFERDLTYWLSKI